MNVRTGVEELSQHQGAGAGAGAREELVQGRGSGNGDCILNYERSPLGYKGIVQSVYGAWLDVYFRAITFDI